MLRMLRRLNVEGVESLEITIVREKLKIKNRFFAALPRNVGAGCFAQNL